MKTNVKMALCFSSTESSCSRSVSFLNRAVSLMSKPAAICLVICRNHSCHWSFMATPHTSHPTSLPFKSACAAQQTTNQQKSVLATTIYILIFYYFRNILIIVLVTWSYCPVKTSDHSLSLRLSGQGRGQPMLHPETFPFIHRRVMSCTERIGWSSYLSSQVSKKDFAILQTKWHPLVALVQHNTWVINLIWSGN